MASKSVVYLISSSEEDSEGELDLASRINKRSLNKFENSNSSKTSTSSSISSPPKPNSNQLLSGNLQNNKENESVYNLKECSSEELNEDIHLSDGELPDIENFTLLSDPIFTGTQQEVSPIHQSITSSVNAASKKAKCSSNLSDLSVKERKLMEREAKREEREAKKEEKERLKQQKEEERRIRKAVKPGECHKYIIVKIDRKLLERLEGSQIVSHLSSLEVRYEAIDASVPCSVSFVRQEAVTGELKDEKEVIVILPLEDFLAQVHNQVSPSNGASTFRERCCKWKTDTGGAAITVVICGLDEYYRKQKGTLQKALRDELLANEGGKPKRRKKASAQTVVSRIDIEEAMVSAQIELGINMRLFATPAKVADFVGQVAKSVAERPFKLDRADAEFSWYAEGSNTNCVKVDRMGVGLLKLWHQQLRQFNNVGSETAHAIAKQYPSPQSLIKAYADLSAKDAMKLLADIPVRRGVGVLANTRKVGGELSKKIYKFFQDTDPETCI